MTFQLDTTGGVIGATAWNSPEGQAARHRELMQGRPHGETVWEDLDPFTQGYVEALFQSVQVDALGATYAERPLLIPAFSSLAPETLARIMADCEAYWIEYDKMWGLSRHPEGQRRQGAVLWNDRQRGIVTNYPPLTVHLGDDGKVRFA